MKVLSVEKKNLEYLSVETPVTIFNLYISDAMVIRSRRNQQLMLFLPLLIFILPYVSDFLGH